MAARNENTFVFAKMVRLLWKKYAAGSYWTAIMIKPDKLRIIIGQSEALKYEHYIMKIAQGEIFSYACKQKVLAVSVSIYVTFIQYCLSSKAHWPGSFRVKMNISEFSIYDELDDSGGLCNALLSIK